MPLRASRRPTKRTFTRPGTLIGSGAAPIGDAMRDEADSVTRKLDPVLLLDLLQARLAPGDERRCTLVAAPLEREQLPDFWMPRIKPGIDPSDGLQRCVKAENAREATVFQNGNALRIPVRHLHDVHRVRVINPAQLSEYARGEVRDSRRSVNAFGRVHWPRHDPMHPDAIIEIDTFLLLGLRENPHHVASPGERQSQLVAEPTDAVQLLGRYS